MSGWRYIAQRLNGDGSGTFLHHELPLSGVSIADVLSGPNQLTGSVPVEWKTLKDSTGRCILEPWSTAIFAEADGEIRGGGILADRQSKGPALELDCVGFAGYAKGQPYTDSKFWVEVDPMDMAREIWTHLQGQPFGNLGLVLDSTTSPVRIGTELQQVEFDTQNGPVSFEAGPYKLNWYSTDDLGKAFDDLAEQTPFEYRETHEWNADRTAITHRLHMGYPTLGRRRTDLTFVYGENFTTTPTIDTNADQFANAVLALGAGEGRDMLRSEVITRPDGRLRRVAVVTDKSLRSKSGLVTLARRELAIRSIIDGDIEEISVRDHPHAPLGSWKVGDEIRVQADTGWDSVDLWCRILSSVTSPEAPDVAKLVIRRSDRLALS